MAFVAATAGFVVFASAMVYVTHQNRERINDNARTADALCSAAAGARDFWITVRDTTEELLLDPNLSPVERSSNEHYVLALRKVITAADGVAHGCDGD